MAEIRNDEPNSKKPEEKPVAGDPFEGWPESSKPEAGPAPGLAGDVYGR